MRSGHLDKRHRGCDGMRADSHTATDRVPNSSSNDVANGVPDGISDQYTNGYTNRSLCSWQVH